jgi:hypothetical protein
MEGERDMLSVPSGLMCPISYDRMQDPVILIPSGNTYDCEYICKSLLHHPNLDPSSGVRYYSKLQYCDNLAVRKLLMETYGDKAFQKYDDSGFQTRYEKAPRNRSGGVGVAAAAATTEVAAARPAAAAAARAALAVAVANHPAVRAASAAVARAEEAAAAVAVARARARAVAAVATAAVARAEAAEARFFKAFFVAIVFYFFFILLFLWLLFPPPPW